MRRPRCLRCKKALKPDRIGAGYCLDCSDHFRDSGTWPGFDGNPAHLHRIVLREIVKGREEEVCVCGALEEEHEP